MGLLLLLPAASAGDSASIALAAMCACIVQGFRFRSGFCCRLLLIPLVLLPPLWLNHSVPLLRLRLTHRSLLLTPLVLLPPLAHTRGSVARKDLRSDFASASAVVSSSHHWFC